MSHPILDLEEEGWRALSSGQGAQFYESMLTEDALLVVPGMVVDRATFLEAVQHEKPWSRYEIEDPRLVQLTADSAALVYRVTAQREGQPAYVALISTTYVKRGESWKLAHHQQTPLPSA